MNQESSALRVFNAWVNTLNYGDAKKASDTYRSARLTNDVEESIAVTFAALGWRKAKT